jgi:hypothetical protein
MVASRAGRVGAEILDIDCVPREHLRHFADDADAVVTDERQLQPAGGSRRGRRSRDLGADAQAGQRREGGFERHQVLVGDADADNAGELAGEVRHRRFQPVAVVPADGSGKLLDEAGAIIADDGKNQGDVHELGLRAW